MKFVVTVFSVGNCRVKFPLLDFPLVKSCVAFGFFQSSFSNQVEIHPMPDEYNSVGRVLWEKTCVWILSECYKCESIALEIAIAAINILK